jgi:NADH-quinone oxidoreductase subunit M
MYQRVFYGEVTNEKNRLLADCDFREKLLLTIIAAVILGMGVYPQPFLRRMDKSVTAIMLRLEKRTMIYAERAPVRLPGGGR